MEHNLNNTYHFSAESNPLSSIVNHKSFFYYLKRFFLTLILLLTLKGYSESNYSSPSNKIDSLPKVVVNEVPELTPENVYAYLARAGVKHPEIVLRQSILETGWYECEHCSLKHNNIFGFRYKKKYIEFEDWTESIKYYKNWQDKRYEGGDYYKFLKKVGYATSKAYVKKLKSIQLDFL